MAVFEIALVRLSETSDYLPGQVNNPLVVIPWTSEKLQPDFICHRHKRPNDVGCYCHKVTTAVLASDQLPLMFIQSAPQPMSHRAGVEIKPNFPLARGMSSPEKLLVPKKNH